MSSKPQALGFFAPTPKGLKEQRQMLRGEEMLTVELLHRAVPVSHTTAGLRAVSGGKPINPAGVQRYLESKFGDAFQDTYEAMRLLAKSKRSAALAQEAYHLYEQFRPAIAAGTQGWGATGTLNLAVIRELAQ